MSAKPSFGIVRSIGSGGRVCIEAMGELAGRWHFADALTFRAFHARNSACKAEIEIENVLVFSGISTDQSWQGTDTHLMPGQTLSASRFCSIFWFFPYPRPPRFLANDNSILY